MRLTKEQNEIRKDEAINSFYETGSIRKTSETTGISRKCVRKYLKESGISIELDADEVQSLRKKIGILKTELTKAEKEKLNTSDVRKYIMGLSEHERKIPNWLSELKDINEDGSSNIGVPSLMLSDVHWSEVVDPDQVFNCNAYNEEIATKRLKKIFGNAIDILINHMKNPNYPGFHLALNGDLLSGDIHEELQITNSQPLMPAFIKLLNLLYEAILLLKKHFGKVFVTVTSGNHDRTTKKKRFKDRVYTNWDWLMGTLLERDFADDEDITIMTATGTDMQYNIYNTTYRQTHGDQFGGGQGFVGVLSPISRGNLKKRLASTAYGKPFDVLLLGHFHQYMPAMKFIANGSVVGYNEFAMGLDCMYEDPIQAMWLTHPTKGITFQWPIFCKEFDEPKGNTPWHS